jgi:hypothetical protein
MRKIVRKMRGTALLLVGIALIAAMPGVAVAQIDNPPLDFDRTPTDRTRDVRRDSDRDLESIMEWLLTAIEHRLEALERMTEAVGNSEYVTKEHAKDLQDDYKDAEKILDNAAKDIEKAETFVELREIASTAFENTLVLALLMPKTHLVVGSDSIAAITGRVGVGERLQEWIIRLEEAGKDMSAAQAALDAMKAAIASAATKAAPVGGNVIGLTPSDWPEPAQSTLQQGRSDLADARGFLLDARELFHEIVALIREAMATD